MLSNDQLVLKHVTLPILAVLIILGNGALILITLRHKSLRNSVTNLLVASLALSDLLTGLVIESDLLTGLVNGSDLLTGLVRVSDLLTELVNVRPTDWTGQCPTY